MSSEVQHVGACMLEPLASLRHTQASSWHIVRHKEGHERVQRCKITSFWASKDRSIVLTFFVGLKENIQGVLVCHCSTAEWILQISCKFFIVAE